jgi:hypothetical protein
MKKIFALILCAMLICATPVMAYAEGGENATEVTENTSTEEIVTEGENSASEPTIPDKIVNFISENYEGSSFLSLAITIVVYTVFSIKKHKALNGTIGILNNNAIKVANDSTNTVIEVMGKADEMAEIIKGYKENFEAVITELRKTAEEKQSLEAMLSNVQKSLDTLKMADIEFGNEVAELLVLANIPNSKKEELYSRHRAAVDAIATAEKTEVISNDGEV